MSQDKVFTTAEKLAKNVRYYREKAGLTREALSLAIGQDNSYISKLENTKMNITLDKLDMIAKFLSVEVEDLFK